MRTALLRGFCFAVAWVLAVGGARAEGLEAGLWKVVTKAEVNGVTGPNSRTTNSTCETSEHEASPQRLKWRLQCKGQLDMDVAGEFLFDAPEHYTATITTRATMLGKEIQHSQASIEAQRVGACQ